MLFILFMSFFCLALFPMRQIMGDHVAWGKHIAKVLIDVFDFQHFSYSCKPSIFKDSLNSAFFCCAVDGMVLLCFMSHPCAFLGSTVTQAQRCTKLQTQGLLPEGGHQRLWSLEFESRSACQCYCLREDHKHKGKSPQQNVCWHWASMKVVADVPGDWISWVLWHNQKSPKPFKFTFK